MSELNNKVDLLKLKVRQITKQEQGMFNSQSYGKWRAMLKQMIPDDCQSRLTNLLLLMMGIFESKSVYLSLLARKIPIRAKKLSLSKQFERFLDNEAVKVEDWLVGYYSLPVQVGQFI